MKPIKRPFSEPTVFPLFPPCAKDCGMAVPPNAVAPANIAADLRTSLRSLDRGSKADFRFFSSCMSALVVIDVLRKLTKLVLSQPTFDAEMRRWWWEKYSKLKAGPAYVPN